MRPRNSEKQLNADLAPADLWAIGVLAIDVGGRFRLLAVSP